MLPSSKRVVGWNDDVAPALVHVEHSNRVALSPPPLWLLLQLQLLLLLLLLDP